MGSGGTARRRGTVFLVVDSPDFTTMPDRVVDGYWDGPPDEDAEGYLEGLPNGMTVAAALQWARERADRVLIRNDDPSFDLPTGRHFWAGRGACPPEIEPLP